MKRIIIPVFVWLCCVPFYADASAYWMEVTGSGKVREALRIQVCYGHIDEFNVRHRDAGKELTLTGEFKVSVVDDKGVSVAVPISLKGDCWEGTFTPARRCIYRVLGINDSHPVVDRSKTGGKNVMPIDYLCAEYMVETERVFGNPLQFLDISVKMQSGIAYIKAFKDSKPSAENTKLRVFNPENWEKELTTNEKGECLFKTTIKGFYIIREDWDEPAPGTYKGINYTSIRYRCNYCLQVK
jgi:hypothetical protein